MINPVTGHEYENSLAPASESKKVLVIGAGPGGLEAARIAAIRGHKVTICDNSKSLGGKMKDAAIPPHKNEIANYINFQCKELSRLGVEVLTECEMTADAVKEFGADEVIVATGATDISLHIPGADGDNVYSYHEALNGKAINGTNIAVIGGGLVGCETAEYLSDQGKGVTIIEMKPDVASDMGLLNRMSMVEHYFGRENFNIITDSILKSIQKSSITVETKSENRDIENIDAVVIAVGSKSDNTLTKALDQAGIKYHAIGECAKAPGQILIAVREAYDIACNL